MRMNTISTPIPYSREEEIKIQKLIIDATPENTKRKVFEEDRLEHLQNAPIASHLTEASYKLEELLGYTDELDAIIYEKIEERNEYNRAVLSCINYKLQNEIDEIHKIDLEQWLELEETIQSQQQAGICVSRKRRPDQRLDLAKFMNPHIVERLKQNSDIYISEPYTPEEVQKNLEEFKISSKNDALRHRINEQFENEEEIYSIVEKLPETKKA